MHAGADDVGTQGPERGLKRVQPGLEEVAGDRLIHRQGQKGPLRAADAAREVALPIQRLRHVLRHLAEAASLFREGDRKGASIDQGRTHPELKIANAPAEGRLREVSHRRRFGEVQRRAEREEILDPGKLHVSRSVRCGRPAPIVCRRIGKVEGHT